MFRRIETEDLIKFGLIPELIGRLPVIAKLDNLDEAALVNILNEPKNSLVKQYTALLDMEDVKLSFTEEALRAIAKKALARKTGARGLRSIVEEILLGTMFDLPSEPTITEVIINEESVNNNVAPEYIKDKAGRVPKKAPPVHVQQMAS